jgi:hypothetical protein
VTAVAMRPVFDRRGPALPGEPFPRNSAAWYRWAKDEHLRRFPDVDEGTRRNLDSFIQSAESREAPQESTAS